MSESQSNDALERPKNPTPKEILDKMNSGIPYSTNDITNKFNNVSRWTIQRRLQKLYKSDKINKKNHTSNRVTWWIPFDCGDE